jgi:hypothetical protein
MMYSETHKVTFTKPALRSLRDKVIESNATTLFASVNTKSMTVRGWTVEANLIPIVNEQSLAFWRQLANKDDDGYVYEMYVTVTFAREDDKKPSSNEFAGILRTMYQRAQQPAFGKWTLSTVDDKPYVVPGDDDDISSNINADLVGYSDVEIPDNWDDNFEHLFGVESHIKRIRGAIEAGIMSQWSNRFHCALIGPPGCGKSDTAQNIKRALGDDAVMEFDATATTAAGAIKELAEREILPRIMIVEEIEKADEKALAFLLAVCDLRGEIRKTTARATIQRNTKVFVIATVNNLELFEKLQAGALASRFANKIFYRRPSRDQLAMILTREVGKIDGDERWIKPALDYCEDHGITDPRMVIALCLCGRDELITGEYQKMLADTSQVDE